MKTQPRLKSQEPALIKYLEGAKQDLLFELRTAAKGSRNAELNRISFILGSVFSGIIQLGIKIPDSEYSLKGNIFTAARQMSEPLPESEMTATTIRSFREGLIKPKDFSEFIDKVEYKQSVKKIEKDKKVQLRVISDKARRFIFAEPSKIIQREPTEQDIENIFRLLKKRLSLSTLEKLGIKICTEPIYGLVLWDTSLITFNPNHLTEFIHVEGRTDLITLADLNLELYSGLVSHFNKESKIELKPGSHIFLIDADVTPEQIKKRLITTGEVSLKFVRLPEKDISDWYFLNPKLEDELFNNVKNAVKEIISANVQNLKNPETTESSDLSSESENQKLTDWKSIFIIPFSDSGNAKRLVKLYGDVIKFNHDSGKWMLWNGRYWTIDKTNRIFEYAKEINEKLWEHRFENLIPGDNKGFEKKLLNNQSLSRINSMLELTKSDDRIAITQKELDSNLMLFNCWNGTYDLDEIQFREHRKEDLLSKIVKVEYCSEAIAPTYDKFIGDIFDNNPILASFVSRLLGLSLTGESLEEILVFCYGSGKNGKTIFFNVNKMIFGGYFKKLPIQSLLQRNGEQIPNDLAQLPGIRFLCTSEMPENRRLNEEKVKDLTGNDRITARYLYKEFFEFNPSHLLWMYGNHKPLISGSDEGIWRRLIIVPFTVRISEEKRIPQNQLLSKLFSERSGILNWIIAGWEEYNNIGLNAPEEVRSLMDEYRSSQDVLADFLRECTKIDKTNSELAKNVYQKYTDWCNEIGEEPLKNRTFYRKLEERDFRIVDANFRKLKKIQGLILKE